MLLKSNLIEKIISEKTILDSDNKEIKVNGIGYYSNDINKPQNRYLLKIKILSNTKHSSNELVVIMLNPSESGKRGIFIDQTITNIIKIANDTGYNSIAILNLITIINPNPNNIEKSEPVNIEFIEQEIKNSENILIAWGQNGTTRIKKK